MTLSELNEICRNNNIQDDVILLSDSGWECSESDICGVYYSEIDHAIVLTQDDDEVEHRIGHATWHILTRNQTLRRLK